VTRPSKRRAAPSSAPAKVNTTGSRSRRRTFAILLLALPLALVVATSAGSVPLPISAVIASVLSSLGLADPPSLPYSAETILWSLRLPRVLLAALVGGGLGLVGAALQSLFRNPMADSGLLGVGPGAALGAVIAIEVGLQDVTFGLPLAAFVGALLSVVLVYVLSHLGGRPTLQGLLLTGLAVAALASAATSVLLVSAQEFRVRAILFWLSGSLEGRGWEHARLGAGVILPGSLLLLLLSRPLDLLSLGDDEAASLSLPVHATRMGTFLLASLVAGPVTALAGSVPFVGLVAPHALRPLVGPLSRHLLPASFLGGALIVVLADLAARTLVARVDLPLGSLTAFVGAPYFLLALRRSERRS
jgi:iron complex transport system permease protein